ncbi:hypothetical protein K227x_28530 [Rubripirellula lacrimiformis]|uniref:Methane oxygenase PmoA n=1 Tax=Rubripirellula lacrimiformis TaxID=1930273 RepID=A0A517NBF2_9BACT|nr:DUF6807 family protein [Rubripirellula lacrimiformis]QDT04462.1 hypothetical protein K227x_28530 [Rubripirellula lacrimiformis]
MFSRSPGILSLWLALATSGIWPALAAAQSPATGSPPSTNQTAATESEVAGPATATSPTSLSLRTDGRDVVTYNAAFLASPNPKTPWFGRSGFIDPVRTPSGIAVTDGFPSDHLHQHGIMFAWTSSSISGRKIDFWNSAKIEGLVQHAGIDSASDDEIVVRLQHIDQGTQPPSVAIEETWKITRVEHPTMTVFDLQSTQVCVLPHPVDILEYHYGALCVRGNDQWRGENRVMQTDSHPDAITANHTRPTWASMSGRVEGKLAGIVAISHPDNFRSPQPVRMHPSEPYFCFAPMVLGEFQLKPQEPYVSRCRFAAYDGDLDVNAVEKLCDFSSDASF